MTWPVAAVVVAACGTVVGIVWVLVWGVVRTAQAAVPLCCCGHGDDGPDDWDDDGPDPDPDPIGREWESLNRAGAR